MKKIIPIIVLLLISTTLLFVGCKAKIPTPSDDAIVYGNGSLCVSKGDYVYYVNGYESYTTIADSHANREGKVNVSSIYVAKRENGELVEKTELVSKVAGFEYSNLYIFGDKLYFTTPNTRKDTTGEVRNDIISLFSVKLNGKKLTEIYTPDQYTSGSFSMNEISGKVYALIYDGAKLIRINVSERKPAVTVLAEGVTSVAFCNDTTTYAEEKQAYIDGTNTGYVYYSRSRTALEGSEAGVGGNIFEKVEIVSGVKTLISSNIDATVVVKTFSGGRVYYTKNDCYYSTDINSGTEMRHTYVAVTSFYPLGIDAQGNNLGVVVGYNSKIYLQTLSQSVIPATSLVEGSATILFGDEEVIFYKDESGNIKSLSTKDNTVRSIYNTSEDITLKADTVYDYDGRYLHFFASKGENESIYLYEIDTFDSIGENSSVTLLGK